MRIVSISKVVPFAGIPHAGGEYYLQHVREVSIRHELTVVAPYEARNLKAVDLNENSIYDIQLAGKRLRESLIGRCARRALNVRRRINPLAPSAELIGTLTSTALRTIYSRADAIEVQWTENAGLVPWIRRINKRAFVTVFAHDVLSQKYERELINSSGLLSPALARLRLAFVRHYEAKYLASADVVIVFSEKDRLLLLEMDPSLSVTVIHPPLADRLPDDPHRKSKNRHQQTVLFTGAFTRPENHAAAMWLLNYVWPKVQDIFPDARLVLAGSGPSDELIMSASSNSGVTLTGYVRSLDDFYSSADCFVAPLFQGAGVKFKVITALSWGIPVVATPIGVEGIGTRELYACVTNRASVFADAVSQILAHPDEARHLAAKSRSWVLSSYGRAQFETSIRDLYFEN